MKFIIGLLLGIALAGGIAFYLNNTQNPFVDKGINQPQPNNQLNANPPGTSSAPLVLAPGTKMHTAASSNIATAKPVASATNYDFYDVLQGKKAIDPQKNASTASGGQAAEHGYLVQVGTFSDPNLADNMKARLALLGYSARIESTQDGDKVINKVIIGPLTNQNAANSLINQLERQQITATIINLN